MKNLIRAIALLFFVFVTVVLITDIKGPEVAFAKDYSADDWYKGWKNYKDDPDPRTTKWALYAFDRAYTMDMAKKSYRKILSYYPYIGHIQEITLDGLVGVKARGENFLVAIFNISAEDIHNKHEAIVLKNLFELAGGREEKVKFYFIDISTDYERAKKVLEEVNLSDDVGLIQYIFRDGIMMTDACSGIPLSAEAILSDLTIPEDEKEIDNFRRWMENYDPGKPGLILYKGKGNGPTYELKPKP